MNDYVVLLGTKGGPAIRQGSTMPTSSLLVLGARKIVVDCGLGVTRALVDQGLDLKEIELVFITHLHSDHYLELGPMLHTAWTAGLDTSVKVYGPSGLDAYWHSFLASMTADIDVRISDEGRSDLRELVSVHVIEDNMKIDASLVVKSMRNIHPPIVDSFALMFQANGKRIVFSGDSAFMPELAHFAAHADLLVHEAILEDALEALVRRIGKNDGRLIAHLRRSHCSASDAGKIAARAKVKALALHHLIPSDDPDYGEKQWLDAVSEHWSGTCYIGRDGLRIDFCE